MLDFLSDREMFDWGDMSDIIYARSTLYQEFKHNNKKPTPSLQRWYKLYTERVKSLTPVAREWLVKMHSHFENTDYKYVTRKRLCVVMRKNSGLGAWDRKVLQKLIDAKLITCERARANNNPVWEYRYSMTLDTGWLVYMMLRAQRAARRKKRVA